MVPLFPDFLLVTVGHRTSGRARTRRRSLTHNKMMKIKGLLFFAKSYNVLLVNGTNVGSRADMSELHNMSKMTGARVTGDVLLSLLFFPRVDEITRGIPTKRPPVTFAEQTDRECMDHVCSLSNGSTARAIDPVPTF